MASAFSSDSSPLVVADQHLAWLERNTSSFNKTIKPFSLVDLMMLVFFTSMKNSSVTCWQSLDISVLASSPLRSRNLMNCAVNKPILAKRYLMLHSKSRICWVWLLLIIPPLSLKVKVLNCKVSKVDGNLVHWRIFSEQFFHSQSLQLVWFREFGIPIYCLKNDSPRSIIEGLSHSGEYYT